MLTDGEDPTWSPDGKRIAFGTATGPIRRIRVINLDGSSPVELTDGGFVPQAFPGGGGDGGPAWSHDGNRIAFIRRHSTSLVGDGVYVMNADGSGINRVAAEDANHLAWLPNDQGIAFEADDPNFGPATRIIHRVIVAVNPDGSNRRLLFSVPDQNAVWLAVAPDGVHFAFEIIPVCLPESQSCDYKCQIMVAGSDMRPVQVTHEGPPSPIDPTVVPDKCAEAPSWSPDSSKLIFDDRGRILVINADGTDRKQITRSSNHTDSEPVWTAA